MFNALKYTQELEKAGFTREQAEISMKLLIDIMNENFATKSDLKESLKELELRLETRFHKIDTRFQEVESRIHTLELKTESGFKELEYKLTIKLGAMMTLAIGVTATLVKLLPTVGH